MAKRAARRRRRSRAGRITAISNHTQLQKLVATVNEHDAITAEMRRDLDVQFRRLAQIQAELDVIKRAWARIKKGA